jgi:hypothetical protein
VSETRGWEAVEGAEARLEDRARAREQRHARRAARARIARWLTTVALPVAGSAAFTWMLESAGGDLRGWTTAQAVAALVGGMLWSAFVAGVVWRRHGVLAWLPAALAVLLAQTAITFGIAFTVLGYGPR